MRSESQRESAAPAAVAAELTDRVEALLEEVAPVPAAPAGVTLGTLAGWDGSGLPLVACPGGAAPRPALTTVALDAAALGREVVLQFLDGDPARPVVLGVIQPPPALPGAAEAAPAARAEAQVDGERVEFVARREIVLRCGEASITLTRAGKVLIQGTYLLSRSTGVNRVKGGAVQIN
jgi:hypothetical protein